MSAETTPPFFDQFGSEVFTSKPWLMRDRRASSLTIQRVLRADAGASRDVIVSKNSSQLAAAENPAAGASNGDSADPGRRP